MQTANNKTEKLKETFEQLVYFIRHKSSSEKSLFTEELYMKTAKNFSILSFLYSRGFCCFVSTSLFFPLGTISLDLVPVH